MGIKQEQRQIKDSEGKEHAYLVIQKPADQGEILKFKLIEMLGPALGKLKGLKTKDGNIDQEAALEAFGEAIQMLFDKHDPEKIMAFLKSVVYGIRRDGEVIGDLNFNDFYTDNMMEFYKAIIFVLEVNFGNFFKGLNLKDKFAKVKVALQA